MEFHELLKEDPAGAFSNYITIAECKRQSLLPVEERDPSISLVLPPELHEDFDDRCKCGSEKIITKTLSSFMCCNPRCKFKVAHSLHKLFVNFDCKNIGERTCLNIVEYAEDVIPGVGHLRYLIDGYANLPMDMYGSTISHFAAAVSKVRSRQLSFAEMVSKIAIPKFESTALSALSDIADTTELAHRIKEFGGVKKFLNNKGIHDPMKIFYFREFLLDIAYAEDKVFKGVVPIGEVNVAVCITGELRLEGTRITKSAYIDLCNRVGMVTKDIRLFNVTKNDAVNTNEFVIADYPSSNRKYLDALEREQTEGTMVNGVLVPKKILHTSEEFLQVLKGHVDHYREALGITSMKKSEEF